MVDEEKALGVQEYEDKKDIGSDSTSFDSDELFKTSAMEIWVWWIIDDRNLNVIALMVLLLYFWYICLKQLPICSISGSVI